jgi:sialate O-acetylesterase
MALRCSLALVFAIAFASPTFAAPNDSEPASTLKLPPIFSHHMVLQRERPVPIWGAASPGLKVTVVFREQTQTTTAGADGKWKVTLDALQAGGPDPLKVNEIVFTDVLVGEVWVGSGQSNMAFGVSTFVQRGDTVLAKLARESYPHVRESVDGGEWSTRIGHSATLFAFGVRLHQELNVPIGMMIGAQGSTPSGNFVTKEMMREDSGAQALIAELKNRDPSTSPGICTSKQGEMGCVFEAKIRPMVGYAIRGVLWDQGEAGTAITGFNQYQAMGVLIRGWRKAWGQGEFPFIYVQKRPGGGCAWDPENPVTKLADPFSPLPAKVPNGDGRFEDFIRMMSYPNTAMVISSDLGGGLHPINKSGYGHRASDVALAMVYGKNNEYYGPKYASHSIADGKVNVGFTHVGQGLAFKHAAEIYGFALAGEDRTFYWADATIAGDTVIVSSAKVPSPVFVRYAWSADRTWANLFNKDGLPAIPFRTDTDVPRSKSKK